MSMGPPGRPSVYEALGEEAGIRAMVDAFFLDLDADPEARAVRGMYPEALEESAQRLTLFMVTWFGGPAEYQRRYGAPRLRKDHATHRIDAAATEAWMRCMERAVRSMDVDGALQDRLVHDLWVVARHIQNQR